MNKRFMLLALFLVFALTVPIAYALDHGKEEKGYQKQEKTNEISQQGHFILKNKTELGITDEQAGKIKDLIAQNKKDSIKSKAEIDTIAVDMKTEMYKDTIDTAALNKLIDRKYDIRKAQAKAEMQAYAALKNILTAEQKKKFKDLCHKCKQDK